MHHYEIDHYPEIAGWFRARGLPVPPLHDFPKEGRIVPGIAAGFLIQTDTTMAILDFFIGNPDASTGSRDKALTQIAQELIGRAHHLGFRRVTCDSQLDTIVRRARALGFEDLGDFRVFVKEI